MINCAAMSALPVAADQAPNAPGVYFFLGADTELLYVGKAGSLARRLRQHARSKPGSGGDRLDVLYARVHEVRWQVLPDVDAAAAREADVIVALRPVFNASLADEGRWHYINVEPIDGDDQRLRFTLSVAAAAKSRSYGCFPHLGRGVSSRPAIACSDGYTAMLRLLWAASDAGNRHVPTRITRSAPDVFDASVRASLHAPLHAFLSGTSSRLVAALAADEERTERVLAPALRRDREAATSFFRYGPRALRELRLRHGRASGPLSRASIEAIVAADVRDAIGEFRVPVRDDVTDKMLGRRAHPWARSRAR